MFFHFSFEGEQTCSTPTDNRDVTIDAANGAVVGHRGSIAIKVCSGELRPTATFEASPSPNLDIALTASGWRPLSESPLSSPGSRAHGRDPKRRNKRTSWRKACPAQFPVEAKLHTLLMKRDCTRRILHRRQQVHTYLQAIQHQRPGTYLQEVQRFKYVVSRSSLLSSSPLPSPSYHPSSSSAEQITTPTNSVSHPEKPLSSPTVPSPVQKLAPTSTVAKSSPTPRPTTTSTPTACKRKPSILRQANSPSSFKRSTDENLHARARQTKGGRTSSTQRKVPLRDIQNVHHSANQSAHASSPKALHKSSSSTIASSSSSLLSSFSSSSCSSPVGGSPVSSSPVTLVAAFGRLSMSRNQLSNLVQENGGELVPFSNKIKYLIVPEDYSTSSQRVQIQQRVKVARNMGVLTITENGLIEILSQKEQPPYSNTNDSKENNMYIANSNNTPISLAHRR